MSVVYLDGKWVPKSQAKLSVFDHGVLYGDGVFEGMRAYNGVVFRLMEHLERLERSAAMICLKLPKSLTQMTQIVDQALKKNKLKEAYIRLLLTRGVGDLGLDPRACPKPSLVVIADKLALFPEKCYRVGLSAVMAETRRNDVNALPPMIKSMNYLNNILARIEANEKNVPEAIMLNIEGFVTECTGDNVFYIKGERIVTPSVSVGILEGITRNVVMEIVRRETNFKMVEDKFGPAHLIAADEVFFTGSAAEVIPVTKIDGKTIGNGKPGAKTLDLITRFREVIHLETTGKIKR